MALILLLVVAAVETSSASKWERKSLTLAIVVAIVASGILAIGAHAAPPSARISAVARISAPTTTGNAETGATS